MPRIATGLSIVLSLTGCYTTQQAWYHSKLYLSRQPIKELLASPDTDPTLKEKLLLVETLRDFARKQGLHSDHVYHHFIYLKSDSLGYMLQAAEPTRFRAKTFWFPFVGNVPYLGFYDKNDRDLKAAALTAEGYDVYTSGMGGFSTLGWFEDPVYETMLKGSLEQIVSLFFHEWAHHTVWIKNDAVLNENLASFCEYHLTKAFLEESKAQNAQKAKEDYLTYLADEKLFKGWVKDLKAKLELYYLHCQGTCPQKPLIFKEALDHKPVFQQYDFTRRTIWNNATIMATSLYTPELSDIESAFACFKGNMGSFLKKVASSTLSQVCTH
jgi:predicted aminopeptidase